MGFTSIADFRHDAADLIPGTERSRLGIVNSQAFGETKNMELKIPAPCHLEQARRSVATEGASKDPENASSAMPIRGVLPRLRVLLLRVRDGFRSNAVSGTVPR